MLSSIFYNLKWSNLVKRSENETFERSAVLISDRNLCLKTERNVRFSALFCVQSKLVPNKTPTCRGRLAQSGERPPTNPAIRVRDSPTAIRRDFFCGGNYAQPRLLKNTFAANKYRSRHLLDKKRTSQSWLSKMGAVTRINWSLWSRTEILYKQRITQRWENRICNLLQYQLTALTYGGSTSVDWK